MRQPDIFKMYGIWTYPRQWSTDMVGRFLSTHLLQDMVRIKVGTSPDSWKIDVGGCKSIRKLYVAERSYRGDDFITPSSQAFRRARHPEGGLHPGRSIHWTAFPRSFLILTAWPYDSTETETVGGIDEVGKWMVVEVCCAPDEVALSRDGLWCLKSASLKGLFSPWLVRLVVTEVCSGRTSRWDSFEEWALVKLEKEPDEYCTNWLLRSIPWNTSFPWKWKRHFFKFYKNLITRRKVLFETFSLWCAVWQPSKSGAWHTAYSVENTLFGWRVQLGCSLSFLKPSSTLRASSLDPIPHLAKLSLLNRSAVE